MQEKDKKPFDANQFHIAMESKEVQKTLQRVVGKIIDEKIAEGDPLYLEALAAYAHQN